MILIIHHDKDPRRSRSGGGPQRWTQPATVSILFWVTSDPSSTEGEKFQSTGYLTHSQKGKEKQRDDKARRENRQKNRKEKKRVEFVRENQAQTDCNRHCLEIVGEDFRLYHIVYSISNNGARTLQRETRTIGISTSITFFFFFPLFSVFFS